MSKQKHLLKLKKRKRRVFRPFSLWRSVRREDWRVWR